MEQDQLLEKVRTIVTEQLGVDLDEVKPESSFADDLGADSLDEVELVMALEEAFETVIPDADVENCKTVQDLVNYLRGRGATV